MSSKSWMRQSMLAAVAFAFATSITIFSPRPVAAGLPTCASLAGGLTGKQGIKSANSVIVAAAGGNVSYCQVNILYGTNPNQNINIFVTLPLSAADGGSGGVQGAWNGRTQAVGGGGCAGASPASLVPVTNTRYVSSGTDLGHVGGDCEPGVNTDGTYNDQFIEVFIRNAIKQQILLSKAVTRTYYGMKPAYDYWNGCSTGGRQGYLLAQGLRRRTRWNSRRCPGDLLEPVPDSADVGPDRHEAIHWRGNRPRQACPGPEICNPGLRRG